MSESLKFEQVKAWQVAFVSQDDGHTLLDHNIYTDESMAWHRASKFKQGSVVSCTSVFRGSDGKLYYLNYKSVLVDIPEKEDVIAKLSSTELAALGLDKAVAKG